MKNIFISSTFRDMQAERDLVQERVLPTLKSEARKYGDNVDVIDLRWGVDTSTLETDEGSAKVLRVCLDEIDRSHPYMLIFLGERYGWIPNGELIEKAVKSRKDRYTTDDFEKSVTALEIEYGALSEEYGELDQCIVCFREPMAHLVPENEREFYLEKEEEPRKKLEALKERIRQDLGDENRLISYSVNWDAEKNEITEFRVGEKNLEEVLIEKYLEMFQDDWKEYEKLSWQEREQLSFAVLKEQKLRSFAGRENLIEEYYNRIANEQRSLILQGETGSGKTAIMCKLAARLQEEGKKVFCFFSGMGTNSNTTEDMVKQMVYYMEELRGYQHEKVESFEDNYDYLLELCENTNEKVYFLIDAVDQLFMDDYLEKWVFFISNDNVQMVVSCTLSFEIHPNIKLDTQSNVQIEAIPQLKDEDAKVIIQSIFASQNRNTYEEIEKRILEKESITLPLYISTLIQRLNMMDEDELKQAHTEEEIIALASDIIEKMPKEADAAVVNVLRDAMDKIGDSNGTLEFALNLIAVSRYGLRIRDLQEVCKAQGRAFDVLDFTLLLKYMDVFFYIRQDDRIDFTHKIVRQGLLKDISDKEMYAEVLKAYVYDLEQMDIVRLTEGIHLAHVCRDTVFAKELIGNYLDWIDDKTGLSEDDVTEEMIDEYYQYMLFQREMKHAIMADEGAFCVLLINQENEGDSRICRYLYNGINFAKIRKEMLVQNNICIRLVEFYKEIQKKTESFDALLSVMAVLETLRLNYDALGDEENRDNCKYEIDLYYIDLDWIEADKDNYLDVIALYCATPDTGGFFNEITKQKRYRKAEAIFQEYANEEYLSEDAISAARRIYSGLGGDAVSKDSLDYVLKKVMYTCELRKRECDVLTSMISMGGILSEFASYFIERFFFMDLKDKQDVLKTLNSCIEMTLSQYNSLIEENYMMRVSEINLLSLHNMLRMEEIEDEDYEDFLMQNHHLQESMKKVMEYTETGILQESLDMEQDWSEKVKEYVQTKKGWKEAGLDQIRSSNAFDIKARDSLKLIEKCMMLIMYAQHGEEEISFLQLSLEMRKVWAELWNLLGEKEKAEKQWLKAYSMEKAMCAFSGNGNQLAYYIPGRARALMRKQEYETAYHISIQAAEGFDVTQLSNDEMIMWMRCKLCAAKAVLEMGAKDQYVAELDEILETIEPYIELNVVTNECLEHYQAILEDLKWELRFRFRWKDAKKYKNKLKEFVNTYPSVAVADLTWLFL